jgi:hypothetical protein
VTKDFGRRSRRFRAGGALGAFLASVPLPSLAATLGPPLSSSSGPPEWTA